MSQKESSISNFISAAGVILAISYPVLAVSTGFRAIYQLFIERPIEAPIGSSFSLVAATCYAIATIGFTNKTAWAWKLSLYVLLFETGLTFIVGGLSFYEPFDAVVGRNVWQYLGADYGYFPLFQPLLGIAWLFHPDSKKLYK